MPIVTLDLLDQGGLVLDRNSVAIPVPGWSRLENVALRNGRLGNRFGDQQYVTGASFAPKNLFFSVDTGNPIMLAMGDTNAWLVGTTGALTDITPATPFTASDAWTGGDFNGIVVVANGSNTPQYFQPGVSTKLADLPHWQAGVLVGGVAFYKNFIVGYDVTKSGTRYPNLVKWSHPADPNDVPISWDETDPTRDAGEFPLADTIGAVLYAKEQRGSLVLYKDNSVYAMTYVGGAFVHSFRKLFDGYGILGPRCAAALPDGKHAVMGADDIYVHDGQSAMSISDEVVRGYIYDNMADGASTHSYVVHNSQLAEIWFCVPLGTETWPTTAFCWNYKRNIWTGTRSINEARDIAAGAAPSVSGLSTWDGGAGSWDADQAQWNQRPLGQGYAQLYGAYPARNEIRTMQVSLDSMDAPLAMVAERGGMGVAFQQQKPPDMHSLKFIRGARPVVSGEAGGVIQFEFGFQARPDEAPVYLPAVDFTIGSSTFVPFTGTGRLIAIRVSSTGVPFELYAIELDVDYAGNF